LYATVNRLPQQLVTVVPSAQCERIHSAHPSSEQQTKWAGSNGRHIRHQTVKNRIPVNNTYHASAITGISPSITVIGHATILSFYHCRTIIEYSIIRYRQ